MPEDTRAGGAATHYFTPRPGTPARRAVVPGRLAGREVEVLTAAGVFSGDRVDLGTRVLLREAPEPPASGSVLDLGCGWGPVGADARPVLAGGDGVGGRRQRAGPGADGGERAPPRAAVRAPGVAGGRAGRCALRRHLV